MSTISIGLALLASLQPLHGASGEPTPQEVDASVSKIHRLARIAMRDEAEAWIQSELGSALKAERASNGFLHVDFSRGFAIFDAAGNINDFELTQPSEMEGDKRLPEEELKARAEQVANAVLPPGLRAVHVEALPFSPEHREFKLKFFAGLDDHPDFVYRSRLFAHSLSMDPVKGRLLALRIVPLPPLQVEPDVSAAKLTEEDGWRTSLEAYAAIKPFYGQADARGGYVYAAPSFDYPLPTRSNWGELRHWMTPEHHDLARREIAIPMFHLIVNASGNIQQFYVDARDGRVLLYLQYSLPAAGEEKREAKLEHGGRWRSRNGAEGTLTLVNAETHGAGHRVTLWNGTHVLTGAFHPDEGLFEAGDSYRVSPELANALATEPLPKRPW